MITEPVVSVIMPVYNGERFLTEAIQSVLDQTFVDFELIVIDDGSTDGSEKILEEFGRKDHRLRVFTQANQGVTITANRGLELARGRYLARLDADDLALPERLEKQVDYLENNKETVVVGAAYQSITEDGTFLRLERPPEHDTAIRWAILFDNPFAHSAVLMRMDTLRSHNLQYIKDVELAEDYAFLSQLLNYGKGGNLHDVLIKRRYHGDQISENSLTAPVLRNTAVMVAQGNIKKLGFDLPQEQMQILTRWSHHFPRVLNESDQMLCLILLDILNRFSIQPGLDKNQLRLVRGRVVLRMLMARSDERGGLLWKYHLLRRLPPSDLACVVRYVLHRRRLLRKVL